MADERDTAFEQERANQLKRLPALQAETEKEIERLLTEATKEIQTVLAGAPTDYQNWSLPQLQKSINQVAAELGEGMATTGTASATAAWDAGIALVDAPIEAAIGLKLAPIVPSVDLRQLMAMRTFMTDRLKNVALEAANRINSELALVIIGARTPSDAVGRVATILQEGGRSRALTIVRNEVGRAYSTASQERKQLAAERLPGLKKQWRRSAKRHSRVTHDAADGQIADVNEPFKIGGADIMYPRDPKAPAKHTINCGCMSLPYMADWEVKHPKEKPFTPEELAGSETKRRLDDLQVNAFDSWAKRLASGKLKAAGNFETAGQIPQSVQQVLARRNIQPTTMEIGVSDRQVLHMLRDAKAAKGKALPAQVVRRLPAALSAPKAVLWDGNAKAPTLVYVVDVPGKAKLGKVVVRLGDVEKRNRHRRHNWIVSAGLDEASNLTPKRGYEIIMGGI